MQELDDIAWLREYVEHDSEEAFATLVARHVNKVYSVALRHTRNPHSAEEITQAVFVILARKSRNLSKSVVLSGWLYQAARLTAMTYVRGEIRRARREEEAHMQTLANETGSEVWPQIAPLLDAAMAALNETDRHAVVLRFFDGKSMKEVGAALGGSEDAAKMRVNRAMERLRTFFTKRGVLMPVAVFTAAVAANSVQAAPPMLAKTATAIAIAKGATASSSTLTLIKGALKIMAWTKAKMAIAVGVGVLLAAGTATVTVEKIHEHENDAWQLGDTSRDFLTEPPYKTVILPTKIAERARRPGHEKELGSISWNAQGRVIGINATIEEMLRKAYMSYESNAPKRMILNVQLPTNRFDFLSNLPHDSQKSLQEEIKRKFGVAGRFETDETDVWFLKVKSPNAPGLKPSTTEVGSTDTGNNHVQAVKCNMNALAKDLENSNSGILVINQTGLTNDFDFELAWDPSDNQEDEVKKLNQALTEQLGLELVPGRAAIKMLIVEKAK